MAVDGLVVVDKPAGWTSHDVVARVRRLADVVIAGAGGIDLHLRAIDGAVVAP